jgi:microcystin-dependent protein
MDPILGQIILWPGTFIPQGWALCDGSRMSIQQYAALYSLLGVTYGGDGTSYFQLPDLRGVVPIGVDKRVPSGALGKTVGATTATVTATTVGAIKVTEANMPPHTHAATFTPAGGATTSVNVAIPVVDTSTTATSTNTPGTTTVLGVPTTPVKPYTTNNATTTLKPFTATGTATCGGTVNNANTGGGTPITPNLAVPVTVSTVQPSMYLNYIIALQGEYPPRP